MTQALSNRAESSADPSIPEIDPAARRVAEGLLWAIFAGYMHTRVSGLEHVPPEGVATIIAANHVSSLDVFAAGHAVKRPGFFLAKEEATRIPIFGRFLKAVGAIPAQRDGRDMRAVKQMVAVLERGHLVGLAPEGTRSLDGTLQEFDPGFVWLGAKTRAHIVPCAIHGTHRLMPKGARYPSRGEIWVRFGAPVDLSAGERLPRSRNQDVADQVREQIRGMLGDLVTETGVENPAAI